MPRSSYSVEITRDAIEHIRALPKRHHRYILRTIRNELSTAPFAETRDKKPMFLPAPFGARWELRFGPRNRFRAFYAVEGDTVLVVAVGMKERERLIIGNIEVSPHEDRVHRRG